MPVSPARAAAFNILLRVAQQDAYATELLHARQHENLSHPDHALTTELVMGVLRWRSLLDERISRASSQKLSRLDPEVLVALRIAAYQILFLSRVPARAAINESVELVKRARKRSAVPFANAVLRKLLALCGDVASAKKSGTDESNDHYTAALSAISAATNPASLAELSAHPPWLVERWTHELGFETARLVCLHNQSVPVTTIRLSDPSWERALQQEGINLEPAKLLTSARRIRSDDVTKTRAFAEGRIAIQDEASQLVALLTGHGPRLLDCCAAPGGKTAILADRNPGSTILAAELHPHRARLLRRLVSAQNVHILAADAQSLPFVIPFDRVLVDVPCSGTGTLARNPEIKWRLQPAHLADLQSRQLDILRAAMTHVAPGGRLVYSTCSLEPEENSHVVEKALACELSFRLLDCRSELQRLKSEGELANNDDNDNFDSLLSGKYLRTIPGVLPIDGFFAAVLERS
jgi:16S rRNA (cytosine967-C5)-methyltransferase